jgi:hypothetical protein
MVTALQNNLKNQINRNDRSFDAAIVPVNYSGIEPAQEIMGENIRKKIVDKDGNVTKTSLVAYFRQRFNLGAHDDLTPQMMTKPLFPGLSPKTLYELVAGLDPGKKMEQKTLAARLIELYDKKNKLRNIWTDEVQPGTGPGGWLDTMEMKKLAPTYRGDHKLDPSEQKALIFDLNLKN